MKNVFLKAIVIVTYILLSYVNISYAKQFKTIVKVGYTQDFGIITDNNAVDKKGFGYDLLKKIEENSNLSFEFISYSQKDAFEALKKGDIDIYGPVTYSENRTNDFNYILTPIGSAQALLVSNIDETIFYSDFSKISNSTISVSNNNPFLLDFNSFMKEKGIDVKLVFSEFENLHKTKADYYLTTNIDERFHKHKNALTLSTKNIYFIANKGKLSISQRVNQEIKKIITHDAHFLERTYLSYYDNTQVSKRFLTKEEAKLLKGKTFKVGYTIDHRPIEFSSDNNKPNGIIIDILNLLADKHGFKVDYVGYDNRDRVIDRQFFDILLAIKDSFPSIYRYYNQTIPFLRLPMVLVANVPSGKVFDKDAPINIGMYEYTSLDYSKITKEFPNSKILTYEGIQEAFQSYVTGNFEAGLLTTTGAEYVYSHFGIDATRIIATDITLPLRFYISKNLPSEYVSIFNTMINHIDEKIISEIVSTQTEAFLPTKSFTSLLMDYLPHVIILTLIFIVGVVYFFLHEQKNKKNEIQKIINTDSMTGLISLHRFREIMQTTIENAKPNEYEVITIDIDYFRIINNIYGFEYGSKTIKTIANALSTHYQSSGATVSRIIGDLFVILHKVNTEENIENITYNYIIPGIKEIVGESFSLSMSIGRYIIDDNQVEINAIIDRANIARLRGKKNHALTCNIFDEQMQKSFEKQTDIVFRMEQALRDKEFTVFYQPKIDYSKLCVGGAEALIRWLPKNAPAFYPDEFIPVFEANGFIVELDFYVFEEVLRFIKKYSQTTKVPVISINISGQTLFDTETPAKIQKLLLKYDISPTEIEVEVTESAILDNDKHMTHRVDELKKIGLTVSMDDFGAGVSSLNRLSSLNIDVIKLDKSFLDYNIMAKKGPVIIENIVRMAKALNLKVVTEGVEKKEQAIWLKEIGCDLAQGYYFAKPLAMIEFLDLLRSEKIYSTQL